MALELRVNDTLEPRAAFLRDVLSLSSGALGKLIVRHPQVCGQSQRLLGWVKGCGAARLIGTGPLSSGPGSQPPAWPSKHCPFPLLTTFILITLFCAMQVLTCTEDMMQQRVDFLRRQGLSQEEIGRAVLAHPQVCGLAAWCRP